MNKSEGTLLVELARIKGERVNKELRFKDQMFYEVGLVDKDNYWVKIIKDNQDTDDELGARFYE